MLKPFLLATTAILLATSVMGQTRYPAVLEGHAVLPALTLAPPPADAPENLPFSSGRALGKSDDNELILLKVTDLLKAK